MRGVDIPQLHHSHNGQGKRTWWEDWVKSSPSPAECTVLEPLQNIFKTQPSCAPTLLYSFRNICLLFKVNVLLIKVIDVLKWKVKQNFQFWQNWHFWKTPQFRIWFQTKLENKECDSALCCASVTRGFCCIWSSWMLIGWMAACVWKPCILIASIACGICCV